MAGPTAQAQDISTSLPLTSVGHRLMWSVGDETLNLKVPVSGKVRLELYSPRVDLTDYRSGSYFGDETYRDSAVTSTFTLLRADGTAVLSKTFTPGPQAWETLIDQNLPAGEYLLKVNTQGNGKNTFAVRLAGVSADLSAERLSVNVHSQEWTPALNVNTDGQGYTLRMYDGDGPRELEVRLRDQAGNVYPLPVSADLTWTDLPIPAGAGQYTVELRQPATARQFSNTVSFTLTRQGAQTPLTVSKVDQTGKLHVTAELLLPTGSVPTQASVLVGQNALNVQGDLTQPLEAGRYPVSAAQVPGAEVGLSSDSVEIVKGSTSEVRVQVKPQVALTLSADKQDICLGDTVTLTARATTAFTGDLPLNLTLTAPGLTISGEASQAGVLSAGNPGEVQVTATATQSGPLTVTAQLNPWNQTQELKLNVLPAATSLQLGRTPLAQTQPGQTVTVQLTLTNTAAEPVTYTLDDQVPQGLSALDSTRFTGTLAAGESRELSYRAQVNDNVSGDLNFQATLNTPACPASQQVNGQLTVQPAPEPERETPQVSRRSTISLPFDAPAQSRELIIAHALPAGASYVAGSSQLNGQALPEPQRGPSGTLYWTLPAPTSKDTAKTAALSGALTYAVSHSDALDALPQPTLAVKLSGNRQEVLQGTLNTQDYAAATPLNSVQQPTLSENDGAIKLPLDNTVVRVRDRISITVEAPLGDIPALTVNGQPVTADLIGTNTQDGVRGVQRLTFVGVPMETGRNVISFMGQQITVNRIGATARLEVQPLSTVADGSTPLRFKIRALDAFDQLTEQPNVTLSSNLEPRLPDANSSEAGYQIRLVDGEGILELQPQSAPTTLQLNLLLNGKVQAHTYEIHPDRNQVGVGMISATLGLNGAALQDNLTWQGRGYYEGPIGQGKLYMAADKDGLPTDENTLVRYPVYGDASTESVPLQGDDPVALTYDHPAFRADYRRTALPVDVLPLGEEVTALTVRTKSDHAPILSGFVAAVPTDRVTDVRITPSGTRVLHLPNSSISAGSETLELVTLERGTGKELRRTTLTRNVDYTLDNQTGVVTLARTLDHTDLQLNEQMVVASYRLENPLSDRQLAYGVQLKKTTRNYSIGVAAVSLDDTVTVGARATYATEKTKASASAAYSGGLQLSADLQSTTTNERQTFGVQLRYQQASYQGLGRFSDGLNASGTYGVKLTERLTFLAAAEYHRTPAASTDPITGISTPDVGQGGSVTARAEYKLNPFSVGLGGKYAFGDQHGFGVVGSVGYHQGNVNVDVVHTQPLSGNLNPTTDISTKFKVARNANLGFTDKIEWGLGHSAALTLDTMLGNVNYALGYELPTASGAGNRARFSVSTTVPLSERLTAGVRGNALYNLQEGQGEIGAGTDLHYKTERLSATLGTDVAYGSKGFGVVVRGGVTGSVNDHLTLSADGLVEKGQERDGTRFSLGYAYRARTLNSLGYVRYVNGTLAGNNPELSTGFSAEYRQPNWAVRGNLDTRTLLNDKDSFTWQAGLGGTAYLNDFLGVSAWGRMIGQPASGFTALGYGVEGNVRVLPGTWLSAGYNLRGFDGLPSAGMYTKQGAYLRLDLTLDETLGRKK